MPSTAPGIRITTNASDQWLGRVIAQKYRLEEKIAEGGMGVVYSARHIDLQTYRAIKLLKTDWRSSPQLRERFEQEIRTTHTVSQKSQHIVTIYDDYGFIDGCGYYVMEMLEGELLSARMTAHPRGLPINQVISHTLQLCEALTIVHQHNILHRDLKPDNLFLAHGTKHEELKLLDFGIAKLMEKPTFSTDSLHFFGTLPYMAPEQLEGPKAASEGGTTQEVDQRADLYALGCVVFEMLAGRPPFPMDSPKTPAAATRVIQAHMSQKPPSLRLLRPDLPPSLYKLISQLLAKSPRDRIGSAEDVAQLLQAVQDEAVLGTPTLSGINNPPTLASAVSRFTKALAVTVLLLSIAFGAQYIWQQRRATADISEVLPGYSHPEPTRRPPKLRSPKPAREPAPQKPKKSSTRAPPQRPHTRAMVLRQRTHPTRKRRARRPRKHTPKSNNTSTASHSWTVKLQPPGYLRQHRLRLPPGVLRRGQHLSIPRSMRRVAITVYRKHQPGYEPCSFFLHRAQAQCTLKPLWREGTRMGLHNYCVAHNPLRHKLKKD